MTARFFWIGILVVALLGATCGWGLAQETLTPGGKRFLKEAASINVMEMQLGRLARERGEDPEVKEFGEQLEMDHGNAKDDLQKVAAANNVKLPPQVERKHAGLLARLTKLSGGEFDRTFVQAMIRSHKKSVARFKKANRRLDDEDLKAWSLHYLPILQEHLDHARSLAQKLGRH
ncbi:hypothetical protein GMLC_43270 [Geomonas limicola]|uniref:DUF4142 domain-containing protein n=1 Tax=Geomonas limicola TaxID=2740186 RepID=A0A6V8NDN1_9BACT|nr:DUF4142 domain-containing protein [Geomonas limicola]GFO70748.1 hypothetical protein GMLC_43270 [Geomonas limicola]